MSGLLCDRKQNLKIKGKLFMIVIGPGADRQRGRHRKRNCYRNVNATMDVQSYKALTG